jgi:two-component system CheB/CheR fusion protein
LIRDVCLFSRHDVTRDPPFAKLDLISCQNLLIYFTPVLQKHVLQRFHYSLKPGGILWLGHSETIGECKHLFTVVDRVNKIYRKQEFSLSLGFQTLLNPRYPKKYPASSPLETLQFEGATKKEIDEVIRNEYPGVLIDEGMEIIQFYGRTAPYLEPTSGRANFNLLKMLRPQLLPDLISTFQSAKKHKASARKDNLRFEENGHSHFFNLKIIQLKPAGLPKKPRYFVVFERTAPPLNSKSGTTLSASQKLNKKRPNKNSTKQKNNSCPTNDDYQTKLDVLADELQRGKEEFQAANEEFQAANEELQSMNEELETTKEELQSGNEELSTVNEELQERSQDQSKFNNDLVNLLNTIEIPIVMLGSDLKICRFTSNINVALNLIATDVGRPIGDITSNFKSLDLKAQVSEVFSTKQSKEFELQTLQGYWYRIQIKIYSTLANSLEGAVVAFFEIDKLKRSIISTRSALAYATSVFESVAVPLVVLDQSLLFRSANESFYRYFKLDRANVEINLTELLVNEESKRSELSRALIDTIDTNTPFPDYELGFNNTEGEQRTLRLNGHNINWSDSEEPKSLLIAINDITEKKKAQETLKVHSLVLQAMADGVCIIDKNGIIIFSNLSKDAMHGYETGQLLGKHFEDFRKSREADTELCAEIKEAIKTQGQWSGELKSLKKDGSLLLTSAKISPIDISGESNWIVVQQDISLKKRVETENAQLFKREKEARLEAEKANKTKDIFLAMLSHELRTPLTAILSWAQVLRLENIDDANRLKGLKAIESNAKSQELLIDDLLDTARIQGGKIDLEVSEIDPLKILKGTLDSARLTANSKSIEIETQIDPFIGTIRADSTRIRQILSNLFTNAIKFSPRASKILVTVERIQKPVGEFIKISVADLGKGISVELLPHIFDLFVQGDSTSTRIHGGLGLGLPIARNLVRLHNGTIEAESPGEGKGSTLTVLLPALPLPTSFREATQKPEVQVEAIQKNSLKNIHILIVEDDPSMREILLYLLDCSGATAKAAESASEGFKIFREFRPDILLSDLAMPGEDGYSLISKIRALSAEQGGMTPAIALTAYAGLEDIQRTLSAGFQLHLSKPVDTFRLIEAIQKTLRSGAASSVPDNTQ